LALRARAFSSRRDKRPGHPGTACLVLDLVERSIASCWNTNPSCRPRAGHPRLSVDGRVRPGRDEGGRSIETAAALARVGVVAVQLPIRRKLPARLLDTRESGSRRSAAIARAISTGPQAGDPQLDLVALLKAERLDNVGGQANGEAIIQLSTRIGAVPLRSTGLHI